MPNSSWNSFSKSLHWLIALCIFVAATLGWVAHEAVMSPGKLQLFLWHKSVGITVLALMILRLVWRLTSTTPPELEAFSTKEAKLARLGHWVVYVFAILMPLSGWIMNSAANYPFQWFGLFEVPMILDADKDIQAAAARAHLALFWVLALLIVGHVAMAFKHHLAGFPLFQRMLPGRWRLLPTLGLLFGLALGWVALAYTNAYTPVGQSSTNDAIAPDAAVEARPVATTNAGEPDAKLWAMTPEKSKLGFLATYDEIEFEGGFADFTPQLNFDPENLSGSRFDVVIDTSTVSTGSSDRDEMLPQEDWFWVENFATARYLANSFEALDDGKFQANGNLDLKGVQKPVALVFEWKANDDGSVQLIGEAVINRTDFGIGAGYWVDDPTVGFEIRVLVDLSLN